MSRIAEEYYRINGHYPEVPGFKEKGGTSEQAAPSVQSAAAVRAAALEVIERVPSSSDEVAAALGRPIWSVRPRISELRAMGKIVETEERRRNASGKSAAVWRVKPRGI